MKMDYKDNYFNFTFTADKSTGLYNNIVGDVYHSIYGALEEAEEKFIAPLDFINNYYCKPEIRVLDICYGIGYNTKAFLKKILQTNYKGNIKIDILEYDKNLVTISPFIKDNLFNTYPEVSYILSASLINEVYNNRDTIKSIMSDKYNYKFFEPFYRNLVKQFYYFGYNYKPQNKNNSFLHNIYYHCISQRHKIPVKHFKFNKIKIKPYFDDARITVQTLKVQYDIIFLDAFTPSKLPTLWSLHFFKELYRLINEDGMLVTYSNSAAVRHAMIDAGFCVGKILDNAGRNSGTVAAKRIELIENKLSDYDIGLLETSAGIYYLDENLEKPAKKILDEHLNRKKHLNLKSSTQYKKDYLQIMEKNNNG